MTRKDLLKRYKNTLVSFVLLLTTLGFGVGASGEVGEYVKEGLGIAIECVIPTSFPFMIISDLYVQYGRPENIRLLQKAFSTLFGFAPSALAPFICGNICGFPIGAKMIADNYEANRLTKEEAERMLPLSNNPSCAFVIGGVGLGIYGNLSIGILMLISIYTAILICAIITRKTPDKNHYTDINMRQNYSFVDSVKRAGTSSIGIISFICIFSVINGLIKKRIKYPPFLYVLYALSEVTNAVKFFSSLHTVPQHFSLCLSAFSLGFGGVCVGMQASAFTLSSGLSMLKYYRIKILEGLLSASVFSILFTVIK